VFARRISVVGTGYVGLTTGACLASLGHRVICADVDEKKIERLRSGEIGIREDGLAEVVSEDVAAGRVSFVVGTAAVLDELEHEELPSRYALLRADADGRGRHSRPRRGRADPRRAAGRCGSSQ
jgi:UDPglucose 6-dehydrogenase